MLLGLLKTTDQSDHRPHFPAYVEATYKQRCVTYKYLRIYTGHVYAGNVEYMNNDRIYKSILTSLRTFISAEK
jgi:hypothetical protein